MGAETRISSFLSEELEETQAVDLRISGAWTIAGLLLISTVCMLAALFLSGTTHSDSLQNLALILIVLTGSGVFVYYKHPQWGVLSVLFVLAVGILLACFWLQIPGLILLLAGLVLLSGVVLNLRTAFYFSVGETLAIGMILFWHPLYLGTGVLAIGLAWLAFLVLLVIYLPVYHAVHWYRVTYNQVQAELRESRGEREERARLIEDLDNANRQMVSLYEKTNSLRQIAEDAEKFKAVFVAMVSHEFRTPLSMIIGLSGVITKNRFLYGTALPNDLVEDMAVINRNCEHLAKLVDDVLDLTRAEAGQLTIHMDWVEIPAEIEDAVTELRPLLEKKKLKLELNLAEDLPRIFCDRLRIRQVILNLVGNSARYSERGTIQLSVTTDAAQAIFQVSDTGPGISSEDQERIFEPFARGKNRPTGETMGSGLGLSICRQFIELHGGQIWVESELGKGSTFTFKIPIYPQNSPHASPARWISQEKIWRDRKPRLTVQSTPTRKRILVIDHNEDFLPLLKRQNSELDFSRADSLEEVIELSRHNPFQAILVNSPSGETTLKTVETLRQDIFDTPLFGCVYPSNRETLTELGALSYLVKPVLIEKLSEVMEAVPGAPRRILIVDDDDDLRQVLGRMLLSLNAGYQIFQASSGEQALEMVQDIPVDLVLLDIVLSGMDGWAVLEAIKQRPDLSEIPVVILSGQDPIHARASSPVLISAYGDGFPVSIMLENALVFSDLLLHPNPIAR